jgi:hypothetical protein
MLLQMVTTTVGLRPMLLLMMITAMVLMQRW